MIFIIQYIEKFSEMTTLHTLNLSRLTLHPRPLQGADVSRKLTVRPSIRKQPGFGASGLVLAATASDSTSVPAPNPSKLVCWPAYFSVLSARRFTDATSLSMIDLGAGPL